MSHKPIQSELHTHSTASDGDHSPSEVAQMCARHDVAIWSLTDHDTCDGCEEAATAAASLGIEFIPGVEITAYEGRSVHVLGYGIDYHHAGLVAFFDARRQARANRMRKMVDAAVGLDLGVTHEQVERIASGANLTRPHLAKALIDSGACKTIHDAFDVYLSLGKPLYIPHEPLTVAACVMQIHQAGGVAILAHPGIYDMDDRIPAWVHQGKLDGIEVGHPSHSEDKQASYTKMCQWLNVLPTMSSDFHGLSSRPDRNLGQVSIDADILDQLRDMIQHRQSTL